MMLSVGIGQSPRFFPNTQFTLHDATLWNVALMEWIVIATALYCISITLSILCMCASVHSAE